MLDSETGLLAKMAEAGKGIGAEWTLAGLAISIEQADGRLPDNNRKNQKSFAGQGGAYFAADLTGLFTALSVAYPLRLCCLKGFAEWVLFV